MCGAEVLAVAGLHCHERLIIANIHYQKQLHQDFTQLPSTVFFTASVICVRSHLCLLSLMVLVLPEKLLTHKKLLSGLDVLGVC